MLTLYADSLGLTTIAEVAGGHETTVLKVVFRLFVHKGSHAAGHLPYTLPLGQGLGNGYAIAVLLHLGGTTGIEGLEEKAYERTDGQQLVLPFVQIDVTIREEVDVFVLRITSCICETTHLLRHGFGSH